MKDILLDNNGDIYVSKDADIVVTDSIMQAIRIRLRWFLGECALYNKDVGTDYYGVVLLKNPDFVLASSEIRSQIMLVEGVIEVPSINISIDAKTREAVISYTVKTDTETYRDEVRICQSME